MKYIFLLFLLFFPLQNSHAYSFEKGERLFKNNCSVCHLGGNNIIIPEKNLKKETLEANGMNTVSSIMYQVINGKNGMPAFGGRLLENEIEEIATYILNQSITNFAESNPLEVENKIN